MESISSHISLSDGSLSCGFLVTYQAYFIIFFDLSSFVLLSSKNIQLADVLLIRF